MANTETKVNELVINTMSEAKYASLKAAGTLNSNELYFVKDDTEGVKSLGSATGDITLGDNLSIDNNILTATNTITSINGKSGAILLGTGLTMDGDTINATGGSGGSTETVTTYTGASSSSASNIPVLLDLIKADKYPNKIKLIYGNYYRTMAAVTPLYINISNGITFTKTIFSNEPKNTYYIPEVSIWADNNISYHSIYNIRSIQSQCFIISDTGLYIRQLKLNTSDDPVNIEDPYTGAMLVYNGSYWGLANYAAGYSNEPYAFNSTFNQDIIVDVEFNISNYTFKKTYHFVYYENIGLSHITDTFFIDSSYVTATFYVTDMSTSPQVTISVDGGYDGSVSSVTLIAGR